MEALIRCITAEGPPAKRSTPDGAGAGLVWYFGHSWLLLVGDMVRLFISALLLLTGAVSASGAIGGEPDLTYIVPSAAGSGDGPAARPLMPDLIFADGSGMPTHLRQYSGMVVIINFWASWCGPCIKEMLFLDRLQGDFRGQPLAVLAISEDQGGIPVVRSFLTRQKYNYRDPLPIPPRQWPRPWTFAVCQPPSSSIATSARCCGSRDPISGTVP